MNEAEKLQIMASESKRATDMIDDAKKLQDLGLASSYANAVIERFLRQDSDVRVTCVKAYTEETFIYKVVSKVMRDHDEAKKGLAPFVRLLHDSLARPEGALQRYDGRCYRWMKLDRATRDKYTVNPDYDLENLFAWAGFTSACRDKEATWGNLSSFDGNTLFIIDQAAGLGPVDISRHSVYPHEYEVLYPLGQQFRKVRCGEWNMSQLKGELGDAGANDSGEWPKTVVHLKAVDEFYDFCENLYRDGGSVQQALPLLEARVQWEKARSGDVALAHRHVAMAKEAQGDFPGALAAYEQARTVYEATGSLKTPGGAALLNNFGSAKEKQGDRAGAVALYREARDLFEELGALGTPGGKYAAAACARLEA
jgi:tetratricopeptide (TPR) repeat protein